MNHELSFPSSIFASVVLGLAATVAFADAPITAATMPAEAAGDGWDVHFFDYKRPATIAVAETTPTRDQADWQRRPAKLSTSAGAPVASKEPAKPLTIDGMNLVRLRFRDADGADVPALLATPADKPRPVHGWPTVIALHGLNSHKAQVLAQVAPTLIRQGFAVLAPDLPLHGERPGDPHAMMQQHDLPGFVARAKQAVQDVRMTIDVAEQRPDLDTRDGVLLAGYSMGAIIGSVAGPADPRIKGMCLMVGGTVELPPIVAMVPQMAAISPQLAIAHFTGRPVLMLNARQDHIIKPDMAQRLFKAAPPATSRQLWYDSGHLLPKSAYEQCANWAHETWRTLNPHP